jgi:integrase
MAITKGIQKTSPGRWRLRITYRENDKLIDTSITVDADTKLEAARKRGEIVAERRAAASGAWTVGEAARLYLESIERTGTRVTRKAQLKHITARFGHLPLRSVKPEDVQRFLAELPAGDTYTLNVRAAFQMVYDYAKRHGRWSGGTPIDDTIPRRRKKTVKEMLQEAEGEQPRRALIGDELERFRASLRRLHPELYPVLETQLGLGCRFSEVSALKWADIDLDTGVVIIRRAQYRGVLGPTKGNAVRYAALGPEALALLRTLPRVSEWVFPRPALRGTRHRQSHPFWVYATVRLAVGEAFREAGITVKSRTHALRHTFVSEARAAGQDDLLRRLVGHQSEEMTERYTAMTAGQLAQIAKFAARVEKGLMGKDPGNETPTP